MTEEYPKEQPIKIKQSARPKGYKGEYLFVTAADKTKWKARLEPIGDGMRQAVKITVSQVDKAGKAIQQEGVPLVGDPATHVFTDAELADPDFSIEARVLRIVEERITFAQGHMKLGRDLSDFVSAQTKA